jgi:hypothetical protein
MSYVGARPVARCVRARRPPDARARVGRRIVIVLRLEVLGTANEVLGAPTALDGSGAGAEGFAAPAAAPQQNYTTPPAQHGGGGVYGGYAGGGANAGGGYAAPQYGGPPQQQQQGGGGGYGGGYGGPPAGGGYGGGGDGGGYGAPAPGGGGGGGGGGGYGAPMGGAGQQGPGQQGGGYGGPAGGQPLAPRYGNPGGAVARNENSARTVPISQLNPYQNRWTIKVRITAKSDIKSYHNDKGDGKLCSFDIMDEARVCLRPLLLCCCLTRMQAACCDRVGLRSELLAAFFPRADG